MREIPVGDILDLPIGSILFNGVKLPRSSVPTSKASNLYLNFDDLNLTLIDRFTKVFSDDGDGNDKLVIPTCSRLIPDDPEYNGALLCVREGDNPFAYIIPCYEVFRFFYAVSSTMAQVFLDSRFVEYRRYVWNPEHTQYDSEFGKAMLWLRPWMLDNDAWFIASIAFTPSAVERGMDIFRSLATDNNRVLRARPPMKGFSMITAEWVEVVNGYGQKSKLITCLISSDWRPPFSTLRFDRDNDGRSIRRANPFQGKKKEYKRERNNSRSGLRNEFIGSESDTAKLNADVPDSAMTAVVKIDNACDRFPWLSQLDEKKLPQLQTEFENLNDYDEAARKRWIDELSTLSGVSSESVVGSVKLTTHEIDQFGAEEDEDEISATNDDDITSPGSLLGIASALANVNKSPVYRVEFLPLWGNPIAFGDFQLYKLPLRVLSYPHSWLYRLYSRQTRYGLAAKITRSDECGHADEVRYVLDFEANPSNSMLVILWTATNRELSTCELQRLVRGFAESKSVMKDLSQIDDLRMGHRKHTFSNSLLADSEQFLQRIFETQLSRRSIRK